MLYHYVLSVEALQASCKNVFLEMEAFFRSRKIHFLNIITFSYLHPLQIPAHALSHPHYHHLTELSLEQPHIPFVFRINVNCEDVWILSHMFTIRSSCVRCLLVWVCVYLFLFDGLSPSKFSLEQENEKKTIANPNAMLSSLLSLSLALALNPSIHFSLFTGWGISFRH